MNNPAKPADMEEILSSIRNTLEEESGKVGKEEQTLPEGDAGDDVLDLSESQMVDEVGAPAKPAAPNDEMFDIEAFAKGGKTRTLSAEEVAKMKADNRLGEEDTVSNVDVAQAEAVAETSAETPAGAAEASDDFDRLLAELKEENGEVPAVTEPAAEAVAPVAAAPAAPQAVMAPAAPSAPVATTGGRMQLPAIPSSTGLQVALPAEILAEALRPLIKDWVAENLPGVVERLVAEEISKLVKE